MTHTAVHTDKDVKGLNLTWHNLLLVSAHCMEKKIVKYIACFLVFLSATATAQTKFQLIKINPDPILLAQTRVPYTAEIRRIDYVWTLQEKGKTLNYPTSDNFFTDNSAKTELATNQSASLKRTKKHPYAENIKTKKPVINQTKIAGKVPRTKTEIVSKAPAPTNDADKINGALKIPANSKALNSGKNTAAFGSSAAEIRAMAFNDIKKKNPELEEKYIAKQQRSKNLMWAGLVLVVLGGIMGFIFGRSAFLISLAGIVFAGIGYFFKI